MAGVKHGQEVAWLLEQAVTPGQIETVRVLIDEMVTSTRAEPGALSYGWFVSEDDRVVAVYERYTDSAAVVTHLATFGEKFAQRSLAAMTPTRMTVFGKPSDKVKQALSAFNPTYLGFFAGFTSR
jgi:quinol monooxygenase YgiN